MRMEVTPHAIERVQQRLRMRRREIKAFLIRMFNNSREAQEEDYLYFQTAPRMGRVYRVAATQSRTFLIVLDARCRSFITVIIARQR